jgi:hypothetical protein
MNSPVFLRGENIIDELSGISHEESQRILSLKSELFNMNGTPKDDVADGFNKSWELLELLKKRNIFWKAMLN